MKASLACLTLLLLVGPAQAGPIDEFSPEKQICFAYSNAKAKAGETESFELFRLFGPTDSTEHIPGAAAEEAKLFSSYGLDVQARFKGDRKAYRQGVYCSEHEDNKVSCGVDCDGGRFVGTFSKDVFNITFDKWGLTLEGGCGDESGVTHTLSNKQAPHGLKLTRRDLAYCEAARAANVETRMRDSVSLRARILSKGWRCLSRTYGDAHLKKNAKQQVKQIAVSILDPPRRGTGEGGSQTKMKVAVAATLRSGKTATAEHTCIGYDDYFSCDDRFRLFRRDGETALLKMGAYDPGPDDKMPDMRIGGVVLSKDDALFKLEGSLNACP